MFLNRFLAIILSVCFFIASLPALAQTNTSTTGQFTILKKGDRMPFNGVAYDMFGNAIILADRNYLIKSYTIELKTQKEKLQADQARDVANLELHNTIQEKAFNAQIKTLKEELDKTRAIAVGNSSSYLWWAAGGTIAGIGLTVLVVWATGRVQQ